jgi:radical SAM protein with 4Fe4S-binding SPASM domain
MLKKILGETDPAFADMKSPCGACTAQLAYDYNGNIICCDDGRSADLFVLGNTKQNVYDDIIKSEKTQDLIKASITSNMLCDYCAYKPYCGVCPVLSYAETGNIIPLITMHSQHKVYEAMFDYIFRKIIFEPEDAKILGDWTR